VTELGFDQHGMEIPQESERTMLVSSRKRTIRVRRARGEDPRWSGILRRSAPGWPRPQERFPRRRLDDQTLAFLADDRIGARQFELARNPNGLVPAVLEELDPPARGCVGVRHRPRHRPSLPDCQSQMQVTPPRSPSPTFGCKRRRARAARGGFPPRRCARPPSRRCGRNGPPIRGGG
jgi:hypothetical protein